MERSGPGLGVEFRLPQDGLELTGGDLKDPGRHLLIPLTGHTGDHARGDTLLVPSNVLNSRVKLNLLTVNTYHVQDPLLGLVINMIKSLMFVSHMTVKVELLELGKSTEAQQTEDLLPEIVAEVAVGPDLLKRTTILYS